MKFFKKRFSLGLKFWNQGVVVSRSLAQSRICFFWNMTAGAFHLQNVSSVPPTEKFQEKAENLKR